MFSMSLVHVSGSHASDPSHAVIACQTYSQQTYTQRGCVKASVHVYLLRVFQQISHRADQALASRRLTTESVGLLERYIIGLISQLLGTVDVENTLAAY